MIKFHIIFYSYISYFKIIVFCFFRIRMYYL